MSIPECQQNKPWWGPQACLNLAFSLPAVLWSAAARYEIIEHRFLPATLFCVLKPLNNIYTRPGPIILALQLGPKQHLFPSSQQILNKGQACLWAKHRLSSQINQIFNSSFFQGLFIRVSGLCMERPHLPWKLGQQIRSPTPDLGIVHHTQMYSDMPYNFLH